MVSAENVDLAQRWFSARFFSVIKDRFLLFFGLAFITMLIPQLLKGFCYTVISGVIACIVFYRLKKDRAVLLRQALSQILEQIRPLLGFGVLISGLLALLIIIFHRYAPNASLLGLSLLLLFLFSMMLLLCAFFLAISVCVVEEQGVLESLRHSLELTRGLRRSIFFLLIKFGLVFFMLALLLSILAKATFFYFYPNASEPIGILISINKLGKEMIFIFLQVIIAIVYYDLADYKRARQPEKPESAS